jgi:glyoxylase I family protein
MTPSAPTSQDKTNAVPAITGVNHFSLTVRDLDASVSWYGQVFGLTKVMDNSHEGGRAVVLVNPQSTFSFGLHAHDANLGEIFSETRTGLDHISFGVSTRAELED